MPKLTKREVDYNHGHKDSHCGTVFPDDIGDCKHYRKGDGHFGSCTKVDGNINPVFWCKEWEKVSK